MASYARFTLRVAAPAQKPAIEEMFQPYCAELDRFPDDHPLPRDGNGRYFSQYFDLYWKEDVRYPYLFLDGAEIAGFALVRHNGSTWELSEFYVKPAFRRRGAARSCATLLAANHPGAWLIGFNRANHAGRALWTSLAEDISHGRAVHEEADAFHEYVEFTAAGNDIEDVT